ncbi:lysosomal acid glucosylceramidase isoform X2 [Lampris incognitus]|uniref:lysosomal acid glucosylceramidase isoform X2 n=1 Tax=Lampris incognitus TaxID=2546036 RepID=UPI0024B49D43|nr:lysosomal acid glucosylceramidase isoform X2 [Lampris incognitus]
MWRRQRNDRRRRASPPGRRASPPGRRAGGLRLGLATRSGVGAGSESSAGKGFSLVVGKMTFSSPWATVLTFALLTVRVAPCAGRQKCVSRDYGHGSVVCECNSTYCDSMGPVTLPPLGQFSSYVSSKAGSRAEEGHGQVQKNRTGADLRLTIVPYQKYQRIRGFGGAMTDAAAINILSLSPDTQDQLLRQYFSSEGIGYNVVRVPMASCDFSTRLYTYADTPGDYSLDNFTLASEDINMKIPLLQRAQALSPRPLALLASAWSAPTWLKTNRALTGKGSLKGQPGGKEHKTWAQYYIRFFEEYAKHNLTFWALTTGNEPSAGRMTNYSFQAMGFTPEEQRDWVAMDLGPAVHTSAHAHTHILILDDNRLLLPHWAKVDLNHYVVGWTDWNLALDRGGGPNWVKNFVDSTVIVDADRDIFFKQPTFYSMAHFSKFLWEGSRRVGVSTSKETALEVTAFIRPDGSVVLTILNRSSSTVQFEVWDPAVGYIPATAPARSLLTLAWNTR